MSAVGLVIGVAFLVMAAGLALRQRRGHGVSRARVPMLSEFSGVRVTPLDVVASALNPKTLPISLTGVAAIFGDVESARCARLRWCC
jgi:hypothetical protein